MLESEISVVCVSEPGSTRLEDSRWFYSVNGSAAIFWLPEISRCSGVLAFAGRDFVSVRFGPVYLTSVYVSPNTSVDYFLDFLDAFKDFYLLIVPL